MFVHVGRERRREVSYRPRDSGLVPRELVAGDRRDGARRMRTAAVRPHGGGSLEGGIHEREWRSRCRQSARACG
jgi:hypothetical protein